MKAKWIWAHRKKHVYNDTIVARKSVRLLQVDKAQVKITADSFYRLFLNGQWVADGPCRSWPHHFQYDLIDVTAYLKQGVNQIEIIARHYGVGDFHGVYQRPGLLFEMNVKPPRGRSETIISDQTWQTADAKDRIRETSKISIQMEPAEMVDARLQSRMRFRPATEICGAHQGPWKNLHPRDVALLSRRPFPLKRFVAANVVTSETHAFCLPAVRLCNPGIVKTNAHIGAACAMATEIRVKQKTTLQLETVCWDVTVDGRVGKSNRFVLTPGTHLIFAVSDRVAVMHCADKTLALRAGSPYTLSNPLDRTYENPWAWIRFQGYHFNLDDLHGFWTPDTRPEVHHIENEFHRYKQRLQRTIKDKKTLLSELGDAARLLPSDKMFVHDIVWEFQHRRVQSAQPNILNPPACISDNPDMTTIQPSRHGDIELCYDLGQQNLGYWQLDLLADEGVTVDCFAVEHIFRDGRPQHTLLNRNGFRYITRQGRNLFTSLKMRSGRYLFLTLRNMKKPVHIRHIGMIESTYPVDYRASFRCSDPVLERIWDISEHTVKLCMTDTYLDCPLYEQTLWVGDARNESLFGYLLFGAEDLAERCIRLAAESLELYPMVGCQVPSSWDCLLPAWSFLWGISVWEYYWQTADTDFLKQYWPAIQQNLNGALSWINEQGLYSAPHWNLFDWSGIDQDQNTVLHNTMLLIGAYHAAGKCARVLGETSQARQWKKLADRCTRAINGYWSEQRKAYPDSLHSDGTISDSISQHTSFLSLLYDIADASFAGDCLQNTLHPPQNMVRVGSPFAIFYLFECWEKLGLYDEIFNSIRENYLPMLRAGATTVWECFPQNNLTEDITDGGPTRSHCHAWSSAPVYFIARILLGIKQTQPGAKAFEISPWVKDLDWAEGTVLSHRGPVSLQWSRCGNELRIHYESPEAAAVQFVPNDTHHGLKITVNGRPWTA